jgi:hypothetical protein
MRTRTVAIALLSTALCAAPFAHGDTKAASTKDSGDPATINGKVVDEQGAVLPGVVVTITSLQGSQAVHTAVTDARGRFVQERPPGAYSVKAVLSGFEPAMVAEVAVRSNQETPLSLTMGLPLLTEQVVVTGTPRVEGLSKLDASFAITTIPHGKIDDVAPLSSADVLKVAPGLWVESSGGKSGANVFVRGFPTTGDAPFLTMQYEGSPLYGESTLSFLEQTTLFRLDETVDRIEVLRGGPNPVFSNGQAGVTANVLPKLGGRKTEGLVKASTSSYGLARGDVFLSGQLGDKWSYAAGGFLRTSNGIRDSQFPADQGGQFSWDVTPKVNLRVVGDNLTDVIALTEGDPRAVPNAYGNLVIGRPIQGRSVEAGVSYKF